MRVNGNGVRLSESLVHGRLTVRLHPDRKPAAGVVGGIVQDRLPSAAQPARREYGAVRVGLSGVADSFQKIP